MQCKIYCGILTEMLEGIMEKEKSNKSGFIMLCLFYTFYYMGSGIYTYLSVYLKSGPGFDTDQIGILLALGQIVAMFSPYFWGLRADKAKNRNTILFIIVAMAAIIAIFIPMNNSFIYVACILITMNLFHPSIMAIADSVSAELCSRNGWSLANTRLMGTLTYAASTFLIGYIFVGDEPAIFYIFSAIFIISLIPIYFTPKVAGYQSGNKRVPYRKLFTNKKLVTLYILAAVVYLTTSFYYSFFSVYFISEEVGGTTGQFGICNGLASVAEFVGLIFAAKYIKKSGAEKTLIISVAFLSIRWFLIGLVPNPVALIFINMLHGCSYGVFALACSVYIDKHVQPEFKASGHAFNTLLSMGLMRALASFTGGFLAKAVPYTTIFICMGAIIAVTTVVYAMKVAKDNRAEINA